MNDMIYISGAITGATPNELMLFHHAEQALSHMGYSSFNPRNHDIPMADTQEDRWITALCRDIAIITRCKGIVVLSTFQQSKGALLEIFTALSLKRELILLPWQGPEWNVFVVKEIRRVQDELWKSVTTHRYTHHERESMGSPSAGFPFHSKR